MTGARITCSPSRRCVLREDAAPGRESTIPWFLTFFHPLLSSPLSDLTLDVDRALPTRESWKPSLPFREQQGTSEGKQAKHRHNDLTSSCFTYTCVFLVSKHLLLAIFLSFCPVTEKEISFGFSVRVKTGRKK